MYLTAVTASTIAAAMAALIYVTAFVALVYLTAVTASSIVATMVALI